MNQIPGRGVLRISLTPTCNLQCSYCHNEGQPRPWLNKKANKTSLDDVYTLIKATSQRGAKVVRFTGGDPGVYHSIIELLKEVEQWKKEFESIEKWGLTTNGIPFFNQTKFDALVNSALTDIAISIDSVEPHELSKPESPVGVSGDEVFTILIVPLLRKFKGKIKINVVFTGNETRTKNVVKYARSLNLNVTVLEVNGVMGYSYDTDKAFKKLSNEIIAEFSLIPKLNEDLNEVYLYDSNGNEVIKFYPDHCAKRECDICRKLDFRVITTPKGLASVPCYEQAQSKLVHLETDGKFDANKMDDAIKYNGKGPDWFTNTAYER